MKNVQSIFQPPKVYLSDLMERNCAIRADIKHDVDCYRIMWTFKGGRTKDEELARDVKLIIDRSTNT